jgi:hypothetical protein
MAIELFRARLFPAVLLMILSLAASLQAKERPAPEFQVAAAFQLPQIPGLGGPAADWRQWDSFFTFVVKRFGQDVSGDLRDSLGEVFLDTRYELSATVGRLSAGDNPVPQLFLNGWNRLSPVMNKALSVLPQPSAERYRNFIGAADKLAVAGQQGAQLGLLQLSPDALRGMARLVQPSGGADPLAYSLGVDNALRQLVGLESATAAPGRRSQLRDFPSVLKARASATFSPGVAFAAEADSKKLKDWVPGSADLKDYLLAVRNLLGALSDKLAAQSKLPEERRPLYQQIVLTAAWQESCWRQFIKRGTPIVSATGDLGLMQVNRNTWRNLYDLKRLTGDIEYNGNAGGEILLYYLSRYALRKNEEQQPGGHLARATYSAYNGGPGHLSRYRAAKQNPELKKVDEAFWNKFQAVSAGREMEVQQCYGK